MEKFDKDELISQILQLSHSGGGVVIITANDWQLLMGAYGSNELARKIGQRALFASPVISSPGGELSFRPYAPIDRGLRKERNGS